MTPDRLERLIRHYPQFRALYESEGVEEIALDDGLVVNVHDVLRGVRGLPPRQMQALVLTCVKGLKEAEAAAIMGLTGRASPVGLYKKIALEKLCEVWNREEGLWEPAT
jgi:DNA-directed RNA polymerase specialized sigma24 family protein